MRALDHFDALQLQQPHVGIGTPPGDGEGFRGNIDTVHHDRHVGTTTGDVHAAYCGSGIVGQYPGFEGQAGTVLGYISETADGLFFQLRPPDGVDGDGHRLQVLHLLAGRYQHFLKLEIFSSQGLHFPALLRLCRSDNRQGPDSQNQSSLLKHISPNCIDIVMPSSLPLAVTAV